MKILSVFGTRPEAIKMAPLVKELGRTPQVVNRVAVTAQHREMLDQVLRLFDIRPDYDLNVMRPGQSLTGVTTAVLQGLEPILQQERPDLLLVHGDTATTFAASLAAYYQQIACGHVEAGLRSGDKYAPFPEEMNRRLTGGLADLHFAPTQAARDNLLAENVPPQHIYVTGNTVIDALLAATQQPCDLAAAGLGDVPWQRRVILLTCHRRENWGQPMREIFRATERALRERPDCFLLFPWHKNPLVRDVARAELGAAVQRGQALFCEPLDYLPFCHVMQNSHLVLTDSGGLQEEAPALGKPVLVLRQVTERPEAVAAGTAQLAGVTEAPVYAALTRLLDDRSAYAAMAHAANPFGDGQASRHIVDAIRDWGRVRGQ